MSLLKRVAIGKGRKVHKDDATRLIAHKDRPVVDKWHQQLRREIDQKQTTDKRP